MRATSRPDSKSLLQRCPGWGSRGARAVQRLGILATAGAALFSSACSEAGGPSAPIALSVNEGRVEPLGFHDASPSFSWKLDDVRRGASQSAYQVVVSGANDGETLWDSGRVDSRQSAYVPYEGPALTSRQRVAWRVKYWDQSGAGSDWSSPFDVELGLLNNSDWEASWIHADKESLPPAAQYGNPVVHLRRVLSIDELPHAARLYVTAKGIVDFRINGQLVTADAFVPGFTDYTQKIETLTYDVGDLLTPGENVLAARLADGWYAGTITDRFYGPNAELLAQLELQAEDGTALTTIVTDESWHYSLDGPITMADIWHGENYDARKELLGWDQAGYLNADAFRPVGVTPVDPAVSLAPKRFQPVRVTETLRPISQRELDGKVLFDLGQNMVGWITIKLPGKEGQPIAVRMSEMLNEDGTLYRDNYRTARSLAVYTPATDGLVDYTPTFTFFGFRYVEISGHDPVATPESGWVQGRVLHTDLARTGTLESSLPKLNKLYNNIVWSQRGNFLDIPTDCPQRDERYGWTGDAQVFAPTSLFNYDAHAFWMSYLESIEIEMGPDGSVPHLIPSNQHGDMLNSAGWGDAAFVIPWELYLRSGDLDVLREFYPMMVQRVAFYAALAQDGVVDEPGGIGDWLQPQRYEPDADLDERSGETSTRLIATSYFGYGAELTARAAEALGKGEEAASHKALFEQVAAAVAREFFDLDGKVIEGTETQTAYVLPLAFGLLDGSLADKAAGQLSRRLQEDGDRLNTGFLGTGLLLPTLDRYGLHEQVMKALFTSEYPSWFFSIDQGATTLWERWNSYTIQQGFGDASMNSFNHYAYGAVGNFLHERIAGLAPTPQDPGYATIVVAPMLDERLPLEWVRATLETRYGTVSNSWERSESGWEMNTTIPPNARGRIVLPFGAAEIEAVVGVAEFTDEAEGAVALVTAGTYQFRIEDE